MTSIGRTLTKGSAKQKSLLIANHMAEESQNGKGILNQQEMAAITASIKSDKDIRIYNQVRKAFEKAERYLAMLSQLRLSYAISLMRLERLHLIRMANSDFEELGNRLLDLIPSDTDKKKARTIAKTFTSISLQRGVRIGDDGYIHLATQLIDDQIEILCEKIRGEQVHLKTAIVVLKDYLKENGLNVKVFKSFVKEIENWARSTKNIGLPNVDVRFSDKLQYEPNYDSVEIDKARYSKLRSDYFNG